MIDHYDVIIVGTGAGGGTLAHTLAPSGRVHAKADADIIAVGRMT